MSPQATQPDIDEAALSALVEEYKCRSSEVLSLDTEIHRWSASYIVALVVGIAWMINVERFPNWRDFFISSDNEPNYKTAYLALATAVINALYILWLTVKGFQAQQIQFYLYSQIGLSISKIIGCPFNSYEVWRRSSVFNGANRIGTTDWRRTFFYASLTTMPFAVSASILGLFMIFVWPFGSILVQPQNQQTHNFLIVFFFFVLVLHFFTALIAISTAHFSNVWREPARKYAEGHSGPRLEMQSEVKVSTKKRRVSPRSTASADINKST